jgi:hypothetical protein
MTKPLHNIMTTGEWDDAQSYRIACDCHDPDHDLSVWIEVENDSETRDVTLTFYKELYTPVWRSGFNRFREALRILFTGTTRVEGTIVLKQSVAQDFLNIVQQSIDQLAKRK